MRVPNGFIPLTIAGENRVTMVLAVRRIHSYGIAFGGLGGAQTWIKTDPGPPEEELFVVESVAEITARIEQVMQGEKP